MERLIVNIGSSSKKYAVYVSGKHVFSCHFEHENNGFSVSVVSGDHVEHIPVDKEVFTEAVRYFLQTYKKYFGEREIGSVGIRVVAPGDFFQSHRVVDSEYIEKLQQATSSAPIHIAATLQEIQLLKELLPHTKVVAASDSAFHADMGEVARSYGIRKTLAEALSLKRFGYHGLSVASIVKTLANSEEEGLPRRMIVLHLGSGCSATALLEGKTIDTSMGFTPLEGLVMSTRSGSFDPAIVLHLLQQGKTQEEVEHILNKESGLLGLSSSTPDMREIIALKDAGDRDALHAFNVFVYQIVKYIGSYSLLLGGLDAIIFSGTIGERSSVVREAIVKELSSLYVGLNKEVNNGAHGDENKVIRISDDGSQFKIFIVPTNESSSIQEAIDLC